MVRGAEVQPGESDSVDHARDLERLTTAKAASIVRHRISPGLPPHFRLRGLRHRVQDPPTRVVRITRQLANRAAGSCRPQRPRHVARPSGPTTNAAHRRSAASTGAPIGWRGERAGGPPRCSLRLRVVQGGWATRPSLGGTSARRTGGGSRGVRCASTCGSQPRHRVGRRGHPCRCRDHGLADLSHGPAPGPARGAGAARRWG